MIVDNINRIVNSVTLISSWKLV